MRKSLIVIVCFIFSLASCRATKIAKTIAVKEKQSLTEGGWSIFTVLYNIGLKLSNGKIDDDGNINVDISYSNKDECSLDVIEGAKLQCVYAIYDDESVFDVSQGTSSFLCVDSTLVLAKETSLYLVCGALTSDNKVITYDSIDLFKVLFHIPIWGLFAIIGVVLLLLISSCIWCCCCCCHCCCYKKKYPNSMYVPINASLL